MSCRLASCRISRIVPPRVVRPIRILRNGRRARSAASTAGGPPIASPSTPASLGSGPGGICGGPATVGGRDPPLWPGGEVLHENTGLSHPCSDTVGGGKVPRRPGLLASGQDKGHDFVERLTGRLGEQMCGLLPERNRQITHSPGQILIACTLHAQPENRGRRPQPLALLPPSRRRRGL